MHACFQIWLLKVSEFGLRIIAPFCNIDKPGISAEVKNESSRFIWNLTQITEYFFQFLVPSSALRDLDNNEMDDPFGF